MNDERPSRAYVFGVYAKRVLRWQRTSYPFLTIDAFAQLADYRFNPVRWRFKDRNKVNITNAEVLFCRGEDLSTLLELHPNLNAKVIICGNSDFEFHQIPSGIPGSVKALFLQNSFISDNQTIYTLPIGLENFRWGVNGNPKLLKKISFTAVRDEVLIGPFGKTHPVRNEVYKDFIERQGPWNVLPMNRISPKKYAKIARSYRYAAAVRGNGIDTHRLWESLYRGIFPIVQEDAWSRSLGELGLPLILIENWGTNTLIRKFDDLPRQSFNPNLLESLWMPYWEEKINSFLN